MLVTEPTVRARLIRCHAFSVFTAFHLPQHLFEFKTMYSHLSKLGSQSHYTSVQKQKCFLNRERKNDMKLLWFWSISVFYVEKGYSKYIICISNILPVILKNCTLVLFLCFGRRCECGWELRVRKKRTGGRVIFSGGFWNC